MKNFFHSLSFVILLWAVIVVAWVTTLMYGLLFEYWWMDVLLHFAGGFWVLVLGWYLAKKLNIEISGFGKNFATFITFISFVVFIGVLWEFWEFISDRYIFLSGYTFLPGVYEDTLSDLLMDILGGITAFLLYSKNGKA